jgi:hypothetical protein
MQVGYYALSLFAGAVIAGAVAAIAGKRAVTSVGRVLAVLMASVFVWSLAAALEAAAPETATKIILSKIEYLGIATVPLLMFLFALRFLRSGRKLGAWLIAALAAIPATTIVLAFTNEHHHLIWSGFTPAANPRDHLLLYDHGQFFWVHAGYSYLLLFATTVILLLAFFRFKGVYRRQALALLLAFPVPWIGNDVPARPRRPGPGSPGAGHRKHGGVPSHSRSGRPPGRHEPGGPPAHRRGRRPGSERSGSPAPGTAGG